MVRRGLSTDRERAISTVAAAFAKDPAWLFVLGEDYERTVGLFAGAIFDVRIGHGEIWVTDDVSSIAMWDKPATDSRPSPEVEQIWASFRTAAGESVFVRLARYNRAVASASSPGLYWYLGVLATHPTHQRTGGASAVLAPALTESDSSGIACCLETSTAANRRFYERLGFTEATDVQIPGGPPTWWLRRVASETGE